MTVLPIVERELRVAARRRSTYWTRSVMGLGAIIVSLVVFFFCFGLPAQQIAPYIFQGLAGLLMLYSLASGRETTDCLSWEKREGTLGLLFLTPLKSHDVVLGKLAATSLRSFYALLAAVPVLAVPLLIGGISYGEFWRIVLTLIDTYLFCLVAGILSSALCREHRQAAALNLNLLLFLAAIPPAAAYTLRYFQPARGLMPELLFSCPLYPFYLSADARYRLEPDHFWRSLAVIHGLTWVLLLLASSVARHTLRERPERLERTGWRGTWRRWSYGDARKQAAFRGRLLDVNPLYWLAGRARFKPVQVWVFLAILASGWLYGWARNGIYWFDHTLILCNAILLHSMLKVWVILEAGQQMSEEREAGMFELLLTTPVNVADILRGQWLALRRQFLGPVLAVVAVELLLMWRLHRHGEDPMVVAMLLAGIVMLAADCAALGWVTMAAALKARTQHRATVVAMMRILVLPWVLWCALIGLPYLWRWLSAPAGPGSLPGWRFCLGWWVALGLGFDLLFGLRAWWMLRHRFREIVLRQFAGPGIAPAMDHPPAADADGTKNLSRTEEGRSQGRPRKHRLRRRMALAGLALILLLAGLASLVWNSRKAPPPPVLVYLAQSNGPPQFFAEFNGVLLILPDGSLWRWGQPGGNNSRKAVVPEQVGTNYDWKQVALGMDCCVGLRANGTLWEWWPATDFSGSPVAVSTEGALPRHDPAWSSNSTSGTTAPSDLEHGWTSIAIGPKGGGAAGMWVPLAGQPTIGYAVRRDGTLWSWDLAQRPDDARLVQANGDHDWAALCGPVFRLRTNGTLWVQGPYFQRVSPGSGQAKDASSMVQVCRETNWLAFASGGFWPQGWTASGELWDLSMLSPDAQAPASMACRLVISNSVPGRHASVWFSERPLYEVRSNGTLWHRGYSPAGLGSVGLGSLNPADWRQVGNRSDWIFIWGTGFTAFGLTADGTVWTWGADPGRDPAEDLSTRLKMMQLRVQALFRTGRWPGGTVMMPYMQPEPRPLLRLVATNSPHNAKGGKTEAEKR